MIYITKTNKGIYMSEQKWKKCVYTYTFDWFYDINPYVM